VDRPLNPVYVVADCYQTDIVKKIRLALPLNFCLNFYEFCQNKKMPGKIIWGHF